MKLLHYARDRDFVFVTNNASDFRRLYAAAPLHARLVILLPMVGRDLQRELFRGARRTGSDREPIDHLDLDGEA